MRRNLSHTFPKIQYLKRCYFCQWIYKHEWVFWYIRFYIGSSECSFVIRKWMLYSHGQYEIIKVLQSRQNEFGFSFLHDCRFDSEGFAIISTDFTVINSLYVFSKLSSNKIIGFFFVVVQPFMSFGQKVIIASKTISTQMKNNLFELPPRSIWSQATRKYFSTRFNAWGATTP